VNDPVFCVGVQPVEAGAGDHRLVLGLGLTQVGSRDADTARVPIGRPSTKTARWAWTW
jgi:hypothetical protein